MPEHITDVLSVANGSLVPTGNVAQKLLAANFNVNALRTNDVLRKEEWVHYDSALLQIAKDTLVAVQDLMSLGLTFDLPNALGKTSVEWERQSDMTPANISMSGITPGDESRLDFNLTAIPVPIIHKDFHINIRALMASRDKGMPLDTAQLIASGRRVMEANEDLVFNGATIGGTNGTIYGYTTAVNRSTGSTTASWATATGEQILADLIDMITDAVADNHYGPYYLYVSWAANVHLDEDFKAASDKSIRQRLMEVASLAAIRATTRITDDEALLVQMSVDVVDLVTGMQPTVVQWDALGGMQMNFKVMSIMVPRMKDDYSAQSGIVHYS